MLPTVVLVKPPEQSQFNFGTFSLGVLAGAIRDIAKVHIIDASSLSLDKTVNLIAQFSPDWIGITTMSLSSLPPVASLIQLIHLKGLKANIVVGGHGGSMLPESPLKAGADFVVRGEGELAFKAILLNGSPKATNGIIWLNKDNGQLAENKAFDFIEPLDLLNPPARDLMPVSTNQVHLLETSRGCPHSCSFCETTRFYGRRWRPMTASRVAQDVEELVKDHDAWIIEITDDNFGASKKRVLDICTLLSRQELPAFFMLSARGDDLMADPKILPAMAKARMLRVSLGVETLSPQLAKRVGKCIDINLYQKLFDRMRFLGMFSVASFIVGLPGETKKESAESLQLAIEAGPDAAQFVPFFPFPNLPFENDSRGLEPDQNSVVLAEQMTTSFYKNDRVLRRLRNAAAKEGVRAILAKGTIDKYRVQC